MNNLNSKPNVFFWIIGILALVWNLMGVQQFIMQVNNSESYRASLPAEQLPIIDALPKWYIFIFGVAVIGSAIACVLLLMRRKLAQTAFLIGLIAVLIQSFYNIFINDGRESYVTFQYVMLVSIPIISILFWWYAGYCNKKGWMK